MIATCNYNHAELHPSERVQKRVVLHQSFKAIKEKLSDQKKILYLTFGGSGLWDVLDFVIALNPIETEIKVLSFETDARIVNEARMSKVYRELNQLSTVSIEVCKGRFPDDFFGIHRHREDYDACVIYLDWKDVFKMKHAQDVSDLLGQEVITKNDFIIITSSMTERVTNAPDFGYRHEPLFKRYYGESDSEVRRELFVETLLTSKLRRKETWVGFEREVAPKSVDLLCKYLYKDTSRMGLWLFQVYGSKSPGKVIERKTFTGFRELAETKARRTDNKSLAFKLNK